MGLRVLERFLNSVSDAMFWVLIVFAIGAVVMFGIRGLIDFLTVDEKEKKTTEEEREER